MFGFCEWGGRGRFCASFGIFGGGGAVEGNVHVKQRYLLLILEKDNDDILILLNQTAEYFFEG